MVANMQAVARAAIWMCVVLASTVSLAAGTETSASDPRAPSAQASSPLPPVTSNRYLERLAAFKTRLIRNVSILGRRIRTTRGLRWSRPNRGGER
jgi:hypothetical protein